MPHTLQNSLKIAYLAEIREDYKAHGYSNEECSELNSYDTGSGIISSLEELGHTVERVGDIKSLVKRLAQAEDGCAPWDLVFNDTSGFFGSAREAQVPGLLEAYNIPFTFSDASTFATCLNKGLTKMTLDFHGVPTAPFAIVSNDSVKGNGFPEEALAAIRSSKYASEILDSFPLFAKPASEGTSKGIDPSSKIHSLRDLEPTIDGLRSKYPGQDILIEPFLKGREFTVGIAGTGNKARVIGILETCWNKRAPAILDPGTAHLNVADSQLDLCDFFTYELKEKWGKLKSQPIEICPDPNDPEVKSACESALRAWQIMKCRDLGRIDVRSSEFGPKAVPYVIEVNPLAGLVPEVSSLAVIAQNAGIPYTKLLETVIESARERIAVA
ncbi:hypothetical protein TWF694_002675 [Orbilia ellipsospora]|uniref:ATP-grasp domain-containing protein n=1 Tax=Orbilia ellipsospora TaxID=2528407 RepID=A0AAV9X2R2_9PEZI